MKRNLFLVLLLLTFVSFAEVAAQSPGAVLKQANKKMGGEKALRSIRSWRKTGGITRLKDGASGAINWQAAQPNFYNAAFDIGGFETETGFNGKSGWARDSREGLRTLTGDASREFQAEANYRNARWLNYKKEKSKLVAGGKSNVNGKPANVLVLTTAKGVAIKMHFDAGDGLLLREEIPAGDRMKISDFSDYRLVDGVQEPFRINQKIGEDVYEIRFEQIVHNPQIAKETFDFPAISGAPLPDIPQLLRELQTNEDRVDAILEDYSFTQKSISRELGKDGVLREKDSVTRQLSFYKGNRIRRLIEKNGKPLTEKQQADEDKNVQKRVAEIEKEIAKKAAREARAVSQSSNGTPDDENQRISIAEVLRASRLVNPRRERFRGREVVVFDFEPNPDFDFKKAKSFLKFFGKTAGAMWIDEQDKQVVRLEAVLFDNYKVGGGFLANLKKGASFALEQTRINDEIWLPSVADISLSVKVLLVKGFNINQIIKSYDYRKFATEVKDSKVDELKP